MARSSSSDPGYGPGPQQEATSSQYELKSHNRDPRAPEMRGIPVSAPQARQMAEDAIAAGRAVRRAQKTGQGYHDALTDFNAKMAGLQQVHTRLHQNVLAIHTLEGQLESGTHSPRTKEYLHRARLNLNSFLNDAGRARNGR